MPLSNFNNSSKQDVAARHTWARINNVMNNTLDQSRTIIDLDSDRNKFAAYQIRNIAGSNSNFNVVGYIGGFTVAP